MRRQNLFQHLSATCGVIFFALGLTASVVPEQTSSIVQVETGMLQGIVDDKVASFYGVPYAAPPVGDLRWMAPRNPKPWSGIRDATKPGCACEQGAATTASNPEFSEDCLFLNITIPSTRAKRPRPVMVWLHGGGFSGGMGKTYDPLRMVVAGDVIVVTINFRLNIFGYFGYPGLKDSGAFGLLDQQAALRWVKRNIAAFGGDPGNVTLFGESGGAVATCAQLTSPGAKGLFHKAILQSGATTTSWPVSTTTLGTNGSFWRPLKAVEAAGQEMAVRMGCPAIPGSAQALQWLRAQSVSNILSHWLEFGTAAFGGRTLPRNPAIALKIGHFHPVPVISGYTRDEGRGMALGMLLMAGGQPMTEAQYQDLMEKAFGTHLPEVQARYPRTNYSSPAMAWAAVHTDRIFASPQIVATRAIAKSSPVYAYEFADPNSPGLLPLFPGFAPGASHSGELPFLFDVENKPIDMTGKHVPLSEEQKSLATVMIRYWTQFARTGNPNSDTTPNWPRFEARESRPQIQILASGTNGIRPSRDAIVEHHHEFWSQFPE